MDALHWALLECCLKQQAVIETQQKEIDSLKEQVKQIDDLKETIAELKKIIYGSTSEKSKGSKKKTVRHKTKRKNSAPHQKVQKVKETTMAVVETPYLHTCQE